MATIKNIGTKKEPNWVIDASFGFDNKGKRQRIRKSGFKTKKDAELFINNYYSDFNKGKIIFNKKDMLFRDFITKWFYEYKINKISTNTKSLYTSIVNADIIPLLADYKLSKINSDVIQNFYNALYNKGLKPSSIGRIMVVLNGSFKFALKKGLISKIPTANIEKMPIKKPKLHYWTKDQAMFFLDKIKDTNIYGEVLTALLTGLRVGEILGLTWDAIDLNEGTLIVKKQIIYDRLKHVKFVSDVLKTSTSYRKISIPNILIEYFKRLYDENKPEKEQFIFTDKYGMIIGPPAISLAFKRYLSKYKELPRITFHGLRHTHATLLIANGENIKVVSERLGHKNINVTLNTYTHVTKEMDSHASQILDNLF